MTTITTPARTPAPTTEPLSFGGCDYLGLSKRPEVIEALRSHALEHGVSSSASRSTTGNRPAHKSLEHTICGFVRSPSAVLLPEGYLANLALCQALSTTHPIAVIDERAHASLHDAAGSPGMRVSTFSHLDPRSAREMIHASSDPVAVMTDGVFAADGAVAPSRELLEALRPEDCLVLDECHALGVLGDAGRGSCEHWALDDPRIILTSTLAKGIGCYGGFVAGPPEIVSRIRASSSAYICTTPVPPALAAAGERALRLVLEEPSLVARVRANATLLGRGLDRIGLVPAQSIPTPTFAFALDDRRIDVLQERLRADGFLVPLIRYPGGPASRYFRVSVTALHTPSQIDRLIECIAQSMRQTI